MPTDSPVFNPASRLSDTDLCLMLRDTSRDVRDSVRQAAADRIEEYVRQLGTFERMIQSFDPTIRPTA